MNRHSAPSDRTQLGRVSRRTLLTSLAVGGLGAAALAACSPAQQSENQPGNTSTTNTGAAGGATGNVTIRLWDEQVQKAYDESFAALMQKNPGLTVKTVLVPYADYFTKLRTDVTGGTADDIFLMNGSYIEPYITSKKIIEIGADFDDLKASWIQPAIEQYSKNGVLYGVPQLTDGGIGVYYNKKLLDEAGITPEQVAALKWGDGDTYLAAARKLTKDTAGKRGDETGFDGTKPAQWGSSAAQDLQGIYYNFLGSAGGKFQEADNKFVFASAEGETAFSYLVALINEHKVAPAASNTNNNGDFVRDQFLQGKVAMFESGIYNLKNVSDGAKFEWGIATIPEGPKGRVSVVNNVVICGSADSKNPEGMKAVLRWLGSAEGASYIGKTGSALPAVSTAQQSFADFWKAKNVDTSVFAEQGKQPSIAAPAGPNYGAALEAWKPHFDEMFLGRKPVAEALKAAQDAANAAMAG